MAFLALVLTVIPGCWWHHGHDDEDWNEEPMATVEDFTVFAGTAEVLRGSLDVTHVNPLSSVDSVTYWEISWPVEHEEVVGLQDYRIELYDVGFDSDGETVGSEHIGTHRTSSQGEGQVSFEWSGEELLEQVGDHEYSHEFGFALLLVDESGGDLPAVWGPLSLSVVVEGEFEETEEDETGDSHPVAEISVDWS